MQQKCGRKHKDGTKISVILDNSLLNKVKDASKDKKVSKTKIIENAIDKYLSNQESEVKNND